MIKAPMYKQVGGILVRTPLFPSNFATEIDDKVLDNEVFRTAILVGSPTLYKNIDRGAKASQAIRKYAKRMTSRPTPFGMFAGVSFGQFASRTSMCRAPDFATQTRPDMSWLMDSIEKLEATKEVREELVVYVRPEVVSCNGRIWLEPTFGIRDKAQRSINLKATEPVLEILRLAEHGIKFKSLCIALSEKYKTHISKNELLCHQLFDMRILCSELCYLHFDWKGLLLKMQSLSPRALDSLSGLVKLGDEIDQWDSCEQKNPKLFLSLLNLASSIAGSAARHLLQVDTRMSLAGSQVSHLIAAEMANSVEYMLRLSPLNSPYVDNFRTEFERRYQMNREVPILELLSPTFGLGSPYDLQLLSRGQTVTERRRNNRLGRIAAEALRSNSNVYRLTNEDLEQLSFWRPASAEAPISVDIFAMISANTRDDIDAGKFEIVLPSRIGENGGGRTLGRFAQLIGSEAMETLTDIARYEALLDPDSIHADVSYLPQESRVANLTIAPIVRRHTIVSNQIPVTNSCNVPLSEIVIGIQNNRFYARWTRTNQRVLAHSNNMLNPAFAPGAIRFLLDIATDGQPQIVPFQWGPVESFPFLPRVVVGKTVLKLAQWDTSALVLKGRDSSTFNERLVAWRTAWRVPRTVQVCSNRIGDDNYLLLDLEKSNDMQLFEEMLKRSSLLVQEYIPCDRWHTTVDGNYATEIVATFVRTDLVAATNKIPYKAKKIEKPSHSECVQTIGSEWVYLKIPCHKTVQDNIILRVQELTKSMQGQGYLTSWFFLRYPEGNEHLRVRFKVKKESLYSHVLPLIFDWSSELVLKSKLSHGVSLETYDREIERYGGSSGIVVAENIFGVDSKLVARLISLQIMKKLDRTVLGVVSVNNFLNGLGLDLSSKINWLRRISRPDSKKVASTKFRESKELFYNLLVCNYSDPNAFRYAEVNAELLAMQGDLAKLGRELKQLEEDGDLSVPVQDLIGSFVHMHCVRLFGVDRDNDYFILALLANSLEMLANRQLRDQPASIGPSDINLTHCEH